MIISLFDSINAKNKIHNQKIAFYFVDDVFDLNDEKL